jgi:UDP-2-acetamido-2,6-beta-L-arabino-hexul-4-ose reductase
MKVLVTGSKGFIGRNLISWLERDSGFQVLQFDIENTVRDLDNWLETADFIFHLAGVNRPESDDMFHAGNVELTAYICNRLCQKERPVPLVLASSIQALLDNPYGQSKRKAELIVTRYAEACRTRAVIYRLKNVFGKWCRPDYNSVVATFCHRIARGEPIHISEPARELELVYIDDVVVHFSGELKPDTSQAITYREVTPYFTTSISRLAELIHSFRQSRNTLLIPDLGDEFVRKLYGTYTSYLEPHDFAYSLDSKCDQRGELAEFLKSSAFGQIFVSRTKPGITRGNHYHHTKTEKFLVIQGEAVIRFRSIRGGEVIEHSIRGEELKVVDIPTGYTHEIENTGSTDLLTLFWASEIFDPNRPDTYAMSVAL